MPGFSAYVSVRFWLLGVLVIVSGLTGGELSAADGKPATVAEAVKAIDLSKFPIMNGAKEPGTRTVAQLSYQAKTDCRAGFEFQRKALADLKWKEAPGSMVTDQYASGMFTRDGFVLSVSVVPGSEPAQVNVFINLHGNVDLSKLPVPKDFKSSYAGPQVAMYTTETSLTEASDACRKLLISAGWEPYGTAGETLFFKQNAVRLTASFFAAPAPEKKTTASFSTEQLSADIPAPVDTVQLQYTDSTRQVLFDTKETQEKIVAFYRETLGKSQWKSTTENTVRIGFRDVLIFRNPVMDMLTLELYPVKDEQVLRVTAKFETAAEVAALEKKLDAQAAAARMKAEKEKNTPLPKVSLMLPTGAKLTEESKSNWEFTLPTGKAKAAVTVIRQQLKDAGWKENALVDDGMVGEVEFTRETQEVRISYVDPGFIPAEVTIRATRAELEKAGGKK